jgi:hypothetical protein
LKQLTEQNYGMEPYLPDQSVQGASTPFVRELKIVTINIEGDKAEVLFDDMVTNRRAILVRLAQRWYVAGIF